MATRTVAEIDIATVIRLMVGRQLEDVYGKPPGASDKCVLRVEGLASGKHFDGVSLNCTPARFWAWRASSAQAAPRWG